MSTSIIPQTTNESKPLAPTRFRQPLNWTSRDEMIVRGYGKMSLRAWLNHCDRAAAAIEACNARHDAWLQNGSQGTFTVTGHEQWAVQWMQACFGNGKRNVLEMAAFYRERRPLFDSPPDPSKIIRCLLCNAVLTNWISRILGYGPVCRTAPMGKAAA